MCTASAPAQFEEVAAAAGLFRGPWTGQYDELNTGVWWSVAGAYRV